MRMFTIIFERLPMVWFLLGLLFIATGLYLGFEYSLSFVYLLVGCSCCVYGVAIYVLQRLDRPKTTAETRLSPNFISVGPSVMTPSTPTTPPKRGQ
jgi:uncharacterized membrane protein